MVRTSRRFRREGRLLEFPVLFDSVFFRGRSSAWLERRPVTPEVASSNLVVPASYIRGLAEQANPFLLVGYK